MTVADLTPAEREDYEERAAIKEYEAGMARSVAESEALREVLAKRGGLPLTFKGIPFEWSR